MCFDLSHSSANSSQIQIHPLSTPTKLCVLVFSNQIHVCFLYILGCVAFHWGMVRLIRGHTPKENGLFLSQQLSVASSCLARGKFHPTCPLHVRIWCHLSLHEACTCCHMLWVHMCNCTVVFQIQSPVVITASGCYTLSIPSSAMIL